MRSIIEIKNLGKEYNIIHTSGKYIALRDILANIIKSPLIFLKRKAKKFIGLETKEEFWALKDVNIEINKGEVVGIIGRNGAGKSTLLKIISQITPPTTGEIILRGKVGSLLEVGTGFHPELTGRENILLNGAILGMKKEEIIRKFNEIVEFSGVEKFLDTPVKYYSSGMYVRLAFSVAAHMEPDILIIDEVLAVGDVEFQRKCLGKMDEVSKKEGRTILFVSHNMNAVEELCSRVILLDKGKIVKQSSDVSDVIKEYVCGKNKDNGSDEWVNITGEYKNNYFIPSKLAITDAGGQKLNMPARNDSEMWVQIEGEIITPDSSLTIGYAVYNEDGNMLYWTFQTDLSDEKRQKLEKGKCIFRGKIPSRILNEGTYRMELISGLHYIEWLNEPGVNAPAVYLSIQGGLSDSPYFMLKRPGIMAPVLDWHYFSIK